MTNRQKPTLTEEQLKKLGEELKMTEYGQYLLTLAEEVK